MKKNIVLALAIAIACIIPALPWLGSDRSGDALAQHSVIRPIGSGQELITPRAVWSNLRTAAAETAATGYDWTATAMTSWTLVRNSSHAPATVEAYIDATNGLFDVWDELGWGVNAVQIAFFSEVDSQAAEVDEDDTFDFELYAFDDSAYGPALPVYLTTGGACIVGTGLCSYQPVSGTAQTYGRWVDTISGTDCWPTGVTITDSATNRICTLTFDMMGNRYLLLRTFNSGGGSTEAGKIGAIIKRF